MFHSTIMSRFFMFEPLQSKLPHKLHSGVGGFLPHNYFIDYAVNYGITAIVLVVVLVFMTKSYGRGY